MSHQYQPTRVSSAHVGTHADTKRAGILLTGGAPGIGRTPDFGRTPDLGGTPGFEDMPNFGDASDIGRVPIVTSADSPLSNSAHVPARTTARVPAPQGRLFSRRSALRATLAAAGSAILLSSPISAFAAEASEETLNALADAQDQLDEVQAQLDAIAEEYQELSKEQDETIASIETVEDQIEQTQDDIDLKQEELEEKQALLGKRVSSSYKNGGTEAIDLLFSSDSFDELIANAYYIEKVNEQDRAAITEIEQIQEELEQQKQHLEDQRAELEELKEQQAEQLAAMQEKQRETQELYDSLDDEVQELIAQRDAEIAAAIEAEKEAERQRKLAQQQSQSSTSTSVSIPAAGSGQDYSSASAAQKRVVDSCYYTASPGQGWCAAWVSYVFSNAGFGSVWGNACDMYNSWCTSSNKSDLQVGMIIAVSTHSLTYAGAIYGHVGIYIGDDQVMHNIGPIATYSLNQWISTYGTTVTPRWGWANGINLANRS